MVTPPRRSGPRPVSLLIGLLLLPASAFAQAWAPTVAPRRAPAGVAAVPPSLRQDGSLPLAATSASLPVLDVAAFLAESARLPAFPLRTGRVLPADIVVGQAGDGWSTLPDGARLQRVELRSAGAAGLRLRFDAGGLPPRGELWVHDGKGRVASGPWLPPAPGWTPVIDGERAVVELLVPPGAPASQPLRVADVLVMAIDPGAPVSGSAALGSCHVDVMCHPEWHPLHNATVHIDSIDGSTGLGCSATLLATQSGDLTPYLMTAQHCVSNEFVADTLAARFFRQTTSCGGPLDVEQTAAYADVLAT